jgi:hypothetical protein
MRCYFIKRGRIAGMEALAEGLSDAEAIKEAHELFWNFPDKTYDGFEIWDELRKVFRRLPGAKTTVHTGVPLSLGPIETEASTVHSHARQEYRDRRVSSGGDA